MKTSISKPVSIRERMNSCVVMTKNWNG